MTISLQQRIIYGPIFSRRLGRSFGIYLFRGHHKVCPFDCVYCEYGKTASPTLNPSTEQIYSIDEIFLGIENFLKKPRTIHYLTFSGNGEPAIHPNFLRIVRGIKSVIAKTRPEVKLALLTNGSKLLDSDTQSALGLIDRVMIKLDAGDGVSFQEINRPGEGFLFVDLLEGLRQTPGLTLQCCLIDGDTTNVRGPAYSAWVEMLGDLKPEEVHIYSIDRPTNDRTVKVVGPVKLQKIQNALRKDLHLNVKAFW